MKKLIWFIFALSVELAFGEGRLSTVSVSENGTVMLATGNPNEFKSSWSGQPGQYKMIIELPGVTVDKTAKVVGNLAANRGIKSVRFSQFRTEPPVARVIIETPERLSYSWSTKPEGVELHFMLPSPVTTSATSPVSTTGFAVPSTAFSQNGAAQPSTAVNRPAPTSTTATRPAGESTAASKVTKAETKASTVTSPNTGTATSVTVAGNKPAPGTKRAGESATPLTGSPTPKTADSTVKQGNVKATPASSGATGKQAAANETIKPTAPTPVSRIAGPPTPPVAATTADKGSPAVKTPVFRLQKDSARTGAVSAQQGKTGTTTPAKSTPPAGASPAPTTGGTGAVVKPTSPTPGPPAQVEKTKSVTAAQAGTPPAPASSASMVVKPGTGGPPTASTATAKPMEAPKTAGTTTAKPAGPAASPSAVTIAKPIATGSAADTVNQEKFKEQLKKALGKLETPAQPTESKPVETGAKASAASTGKSGQTSFQEQLKQALNPAKSLADTGEVADEDDIDTDLPATDEEEEEPYDTTFAIPGGTFMQVSPSRKVIRYHSEGRRDPFSPLTGRDRYASGKKRRAVPAAEQLRLVGIMRSLAGNKAVLEDGEGNGYILSPGDRVRNGYLVSVSESKVLFQVTEYGWTKTVAMELGTFE